MIAFLIAVAIIELTPGPTSAYLVLLSAAQGRRAGILAVGGVTVALAVYLAASLAGLGALLLLWPQGLSLLRWAGIAYLAMLAFDAWRASAATGPAPALAIASPARILGQAMLAAFLNPKTAIFYVSVLPGFVRPDAGPPLAQMATLGLLHIAVAIAVHMALALAGAGLTRLAPAELRDGRALSRASAVGMALVAVWLAFQTA